MCVRACKSVGVHVYVRESNEACVRAYHCVCVCALAIVRVCVLAIVRVCVLAQESEIEELFCAVGFNFLD